MDLTKNKPQFEAFTFQDKNNDVVEVRFDLRKLFTSHVVYINATHIAKQFGKDIREWRKNKDTTDYIKALENSTKVMMGIPLIKTNKSGKNRGTWIHKDLVIFFTRWLSADFAVWADIKIQELITYGHAWVEAREKAKRQFMKVGHLVDTKLIPRMKSENDVRWAYKKESDLLNIAVLGVSAEKYRRDNNIPKGENLRDYLSREQNELLSEAEGFDCALIHMNIDNYYERKHRVGKFISEINGDISEVAA